MHHSRFGWDVILSRYAWNLIRQIRLSGWTVSQMHRELFEIKTIHLSSGSVMFLIAFLGQSWDGTAWHDFSAMTTNFHKLYRVEISRSWKMRLKALTSILQEIRLRIFLYFKNWYVLLISQSIQFELRENYFDFFLKMLSLFS